MGNFSTSLRTYCQNYIVEWLYFRRQIIKVTENENSSFPIPVELFYNNIFPLLEYNDLLRLRRVCKTFKCYSEDFIQNECLNLEREREINENGYSLQNFIHLNFPTKHIYINNSGTAFFENKLLPDFLSYTSTVTHLRLNLLPAHVLGENHTFFENFTKLEHLHIERLVNINRSIIGKVSNYMFAIRSAPEKFSNKNFRNLKTLKITNVEDDLWIVWGNILKLCVNLDFLQYPNLVNCDDMNLQKQVFLVIGYYLQKRIMATKERHTLKVLDFQGIPLSFLTEDEFYRFLGSCVIAGTKIVNLNVQKYPGKQWGRPLNESSHPVISCVNAQNQFDLRYLPHLEKLVATNNCDVFIDRRQPILLPNLKSVDIKVPSNKCVVELEGYGMSKPTLIHHLFDPKFEYGSKLNEIILRFDSFENQEPLSHFYKTNMEITANYLARNLVIKQSCKNIRQLTLYNWPGEGIDLPKLWNGLYFLEEVTIKECRDLTDQAFIGNDEDEPAFLKLTCLQKLSLLDLDKMPGITDVLFSEVFRHLKVQEFYVTGPTPLKSVTVAGIRSLLTGSFVNSVKKFPFEDWSLKNVSLEKFRALRSEFRSSFLL